MDPLADAEAVPDAKVAPVVDAARSDDPCDPDKPDVALTIAGDDHRLILRDEVEMAVALRNRGYEVERIRDMGSGSNLKADIENALRDLATRDELGEVVVFYSGHGARGTGSLVLGDGQYLDLLRFADLIQDIDAERVTVILDSCFSGWWSDLFGLALQVEAGTEDVEVRVLAGSTKDEASYMTGWASHDTRDLIQHLPAGTPDDRVDWGAYQRTPLVVPYRGKTYRQSPQNAFTEPEVPILQDHEHPVQEACVVGEVEAQSYDRRVMLFGKWFGDDTGRVELQDPYGDWIPVPVKYWSDTAITVTLPMRRDGFPSNGVSADLGEVAAGTYALRVVRANGKTSRTEDPDHVHRALQVYRNDWQPYDGVVWNEMWHPMTPASDDTLGATLQLSRLSLTTELEVDLDDLALSDDNAIPETSVGVQGLPGWGYELLPTWRDLDTAYEQSYPEFAYFGFRAGFGDDFRATSGWRYVVAYDCARRATCA